MKSDIVFMEELPHRRQPPISKTVERFLLVTVALLLLVPCFWQPFIHAGDVASHSYNAWLAGEIRSGRAPGLTVVPAYTNVLTDLALERLILAYGRGYAEPIVVALAVEIFFWGAFLFIGGIHGRKPWLVAPSLAMLTYGLVFHFGFLNFYVSTGICLWILWLLWHPSRVRAGCAIPLALLAFVAHPIPVPWAAGSLVYYHLFIRAEASLRPMLLVGGASVVLLTHAGLATLFPALWTVDQLFSLEGMAGLAGVEQVWTYGGKYLYVAGALFIVWGRLFLNRMDRGGMWQDPVVHLWCLSGAIFAATPGAIQFVPRMAPLLYVPQRLSLFTAIFFCAVVGGERHGKRLTRASLLLAAWYFVAMFLDQRALDGIERQIVSLIETIPPRQRVVVALKDAGSERLNGLVHIGSGACIGRCYDYSNYEPATRQFRIRVNAENRVVAHNMDVLRDMEEGRHVVTPAEAPLYSICAERDALVIRRHDAGEKTCMEVIPATPQLTSQ